MTKIGSENLDENNPLRVLLDASLHRVKKLFVFAFDNTDNGDKKVERDNHKKYFFPRVNITNYKVLILSIPLSLYVLLS